MAEPVTLKNCPFCGSDKVIFDRDLDLVPSGVWCRNCKTMVKFLRVKINREKTFGEAMEKIAKMWNERKEQG